MNKKDLMNHYNLNNEEDLYELLVQEKIKELERKEDKSKEPKEEKGFNMNQLKKMQKSFVVSIIDIVFLIGFIFGFTFLYLLFDNAIIPVIVGLVVGTILIILKQQHFASLIMLPVPVFLFIGHYDVFTDIGFILLSIVSLGFLYYKHYNNSFYHYILSIYLIVFFVFYESVQISSIIAFIVLTIAALISTIKLKKYFVSFIYLIGIYIFSLGLIVSILSLVVYFGLVLALLLVLIHSKNTTNLIEKIFSEVFVIAINISITIYLMFVTNIFYDNNIWSKSAIVMLLIFFIIQIYILYKERINNLGSYLMFNILIIFGIPFTIIYGLLNYDNNHFIVTIISLILFFLTNYLLEKKVEINKLFKFIMYYVFIFAIFFKLMMIDLDGLNGFIRLALLFVSSIILLIVAIVSYIKNKNKKNNE